MRFPISLRPFICLTLLSALALSGPFSTVAQNAPLFPVVGLKLTNGLRVLTLEDHNSPIVAVQVWYHVGSVNEPDNRQGFAHLFEHMMFRGTDRLGPTDHTDLIKSVGGECNAFTSFDETCYHESLPATQLELALWLESERMAFLTVDGTGFTTERKVVEEELRMGQNQPYGDAPEKGLPVVFGTHPYSHSPIGSIHCLRMATPADVHEWWKSWYTPNNAVMVIVGDVKAARVQELAEKYFGWIPAVPTPERKVPLLTPFESAREVTIKLENAPAPGAGFAWRTVPDGSPDALPLELAGTILGGGESSRLYRRLVVDDKLAVVAAAGDFELGRGGVFGAGAVLSPLGGDAEKTLTVLREELDRFRKDGVTEKELEKARDQAMSQLILEAQTATGRANLIGHAAVVGTGVDELNSRLGRLRKMTREDLQHVIQTYLSPEHALTASVPGSGVLGSLGKLFLGSRKAEDETPAPFPADTVLRGRPGVVRPANLPLHPPIAEGNSPAPNPAVFESHLANGLRVLIAPNPNTPALEVTLALPYGSWAEEKPGAAAMALSLISKATSAHDEKALAEELESQSIQIAGTADDDSSRISLICLADQSEKGLSLLAEIVTTPTFPEAQLKTAKTQTLTGLSVSDSSPANVAEREFRKHLYAGHPYARRVSGEAPDITALQRDDLTAFWHRAAHPEQATLIIAGALTRERALELGERFFGKWTAAKSETVAEPAPPTPPAGLGILLVDWPGAVQSEIRVGGLGLTSRDPDKPIADMVGSYFGGSMGSRLMKAIRIDKGGTYGASGGFREGRFAGSFRVGTFTKTPSTAETLKLVLAEIHGLADRPPTDDELSLQRRFLLGSAAARFETPEQVAGHFAHLALTGLPLDELQRSLAAIGAATPAQCQALIQRYVDPDHLLILVVGDASKVADDLRKIAPVTVLDRSGKEVKRPAD